MGKVSLASVQSRPTHLSPNGVPHILQHVLVVGGCVAVGGCVITLPSILQLMPVVKKCLGGGGGGWVCHSLHSPPLPTCR